MVVHQVLVKSNKETLEDIATLTGGKFVSDELSIDLKNVDVTMLGRAKQVIVTKDSTTIVEGNKENERFEERVKIIKSSNRKGNLRF